MKYNYMKKTRSLDLLLKNEKRLQENLELVDLVLEVLDARLPAISRNPQLQKMLGNKKRIIVLNKSDLAEKEMTGCWLNYLAGGKWPVLGFNAKRRTEVIKLERLVDSLRPETVKFKRSFRMMVVGIPNVGKSTILNRLLQRYVARTGNTPGITRGAQWIKLRHDLDLLDTPGFLSPFLRNEKSILSLGAIGSLSHGAYDMETAACWLVDQFLAREKTKRIIEKLYMVHGEVAGGLKSSYELLADIGAARGCYKKGAELDILKTSQVLLSDFRRGTLGPITLESPQL